MGCAFNWEYNTVGVLTNELTQGIKHTNQLRAYLSSVASTRDETQELLLQKIVSSFEQSLVILKGSGSPSQSLQPLPPTGGAIESPVSADGCPRSDDMKRSFKDQPELLDISKKRKSQPLGTELVRVSAESTGFECPPDDGYSWRKYGLKDILGAMYPRSYYRCAHRHMHNCRATKQVQRLDDDPSVFEIRYRGHHTCRQVTNSPSFVSSHTTESSYSHSSHSYRTDIGTVLNLYHSESDRTDIFSANTSTSTVNP